MRIRSFDPKRRRLGISYETTIIKCSCPHNTYRKAECRHLKLARSIHDYALAWSNRERAR